MHTHERNIPDDILSRIGTEEGKTDAVVLVRSPPLSPLFLIQLLTPSSCIDQLRAGLCRIPWKRYSRICRRSRRTRRQSRREETVRLILHYLSFPKVVCRELN